MANRVEKRVILFLVEGQNDELALIPPFKSLVMGGARVFSQAIHCDVTIAHLFKGKMQLTVRRDVCETVRTFVLDYLNRGPGYQWADIAQIVHIVDMDGACVPGDLVVEDRSASEIDYSHECIKCPDKAWVERRNAEKSKSLNMMVRKGHLKYRSVSVPYSVYYLSRNFEHALLGIERKLSNEEKDRLAQGFRKRYEGDAEGFMSLLEESAAGIPIGYRDSWEFIKVGARSLERHSNLLHAARELESRGLIDGRIEH